MILSEDIDTLFVMYEFKRIECTECRKDAEYFNETNQGHYCRGCAYKTAREYYMDEEEGVLG